MATTYTSNVQLAMPGVGDTGWAVPLNGNAAVLDAIACIGSLAVTTTEVPSTSLNIHVASGSYVRQDGTLGSYAGVGTFAVSSSINSYLYLDIQNNATLTASNVGWPSSAHVRLAIVSAGSASITQISDQRCAYKVVGSIVDGINWSFGTVSGSQFGTASNQKIGFFGKPPVSQPTMGNATAGSSYGANEQLMLQAVYNAVRTLGLGS